jgi:hypothetical protein
MCEIHAKFCGEYRAFTTEKFQNIWLALPDMARCKSFLILKIRIGNFLAIMQYRLVAELPAYAEDCLLHIHCRSEAG